jgi:hypothetical protein
MEISAIPGMDRKIAEGDKNINGWGVDANPENDPTYPMKHADGSDHQRINYEKAEQQPVNVEILQSIERPGITRVFGTSTPPSGVSGQLRRFAYKFSEASSARWMTLILADRVNAVEGIVDDLKRGYVPNIFAERGWGAEWKYNKKEFIQKVAVAGLVTTAVVAFLLRGKKKNHTVAKSIRKIVKS